MLAGTEEPRGDSRPRLSGGAQLRYSCQAIKPFNEFVRNKLSGNKLSSCARLTAGGRLSPLCFFWYLARNQSVGFDLHQYFRRDQRAHLHHRRRRADIAEELPMRLADFFPFGNVYHEHSRTHYILQRRARLEQGGLDVLKCLNSLSAHVAHADDLAVRARGRGASHMHVGPNPDRTRVTDYRFPRRAAGNVGSFHVASVNHCSRSSESQYLAAKEAVCQQLQA